MEDLLDKSQTFIGVLATIVILCVVANSGNFIYEIFAGVIKQTKEEIQDYLKHIAAISKEFIQTKEYKQVLSEIEYCESLDADASTTMSNKILAYKIELSARTERYLNKYSSIFLRINARIDEIKDSKEQTFAPLYVFGFCIMLFLCDEICHWNSKSIDICIGILSYFMLISIVFWGFIWYKFLNECGKRDIVKEISDINILTNTSPALFIRNANYEQSNKSLKFKTWINQFCICVVCLCIFWLACVILQWKFKCLPPWCIWSMLIMFATGVFIFKGYRHHKTSPRYGKYGHKLLLKHFIALTVLSIVFVSLFYMPSVPDNRIPYEHLHLFRIICICFILINGIFLPFAFPYYVDKQVLSVAKDLDSQVSNMFIKEGEKLNHDLNVTIQKIKEQLEQEKIYKLEIEEERQLELKLLGTDCDLLSMNNIIE